MTTFAKRTLAVALSAVGVVFMLSLAFPVMPNNYALFAGTACFVLSGLAWTLPSRN
jgi:hypothetical protein